MLKRLALTALAAAALTVTVRPADANFFERLFGGVRQAPAGDRAGLARHEPDHPRARPERRQRHAGPQQRGRAPLCLLCAHLRRPLLSGAGAGRHERRRDVPGVLSVGADQGFLGRRHRLRGGAGRLALPRPQDRVSLSQAADLELHLQRQDAVRPARAWTSRTTRLWRAAIWSRPRMAWWRCVGRNQNGPQFAKVDESRLSPRDRGQVGRQSKPSQPQRLERRPGGNDGVSVGRLTIAA